MVIISIEEGGVECYLTVGAKARTENLTRVVELRAQPEGHFT